ncbi:MAG TPA: TIGR03936 family radical SAM-associated protein [Candidatus Lustribacter sp.]|nr:TIGR03936 family radical SAM-associated protein [Candidatus Lustribacter sp.]
MARQRVPEGPPPAPVVQKLRVRYAKRGRLRFSSSRDFQRALERALRRAEVPMAFSAGFHPHPRISYANAAPTGAASEAEYFEISLTRRVEPEVVRAALDQALPVGLDIVTVVEAEPGALADLLEASDWQLELAGLGAPEVQAAVGIFLEAGQTQVTRMMKTGPRTFDVRPAVVQAMVIGSPEPNCAILRVVVRHTTPAVRPDDILTALRAVAGLEPPTPPLVTRLAQGLLREGARLADPLVANESVDGT